MRTRLLIATATTAALLAGAGFAQPSGASGSNFSQSQQPAGDTAVNSPSANQLPPSAATGNAATNLSTPSGQAGTSDSTAPAANAPIAGPQGSSLNNSDASSVAPAAGAPTERAPAATAGTDVVSNGPVPDTPANRAKYGQPLSQTGRMSKAAGN